MKRDDTNLLKETLSVLVRKGKTLEDIVWIGGDNYILSMGEFFELANKEYDSGFGAPEVRPDLMLVGKDFWLERREYDGSEWWEYKTMPTIPKVTRIVETIVNWRDEDDRISDEEWDEYINTTRG